MKHIKRKLISVSVISCLSVVAASAQIKAGDFDVVISRGDPASEVSPARRVERGRPPHSHPISPRNNPSRIQSIDGSGNNFLSSRIGAAGIPLIRNAPNDYGDGISTMAGSNRPSARVVSNQVNQQTQSRPNQLGLSDYVWQWGQFLDHDIDLTEGTDPAEREDISVPGGDPFFDPGSSGTQTIEFNRSIYIQRDNRPREQLNEITAWVDASNVYGSDQERAQELRTRDGTGMLKTSAGNLLPFNEAGLPNAGGSGSELFLGGDVRANEQSGLAAMHTLFVREHNRLAAEIAAADGSLSGKEIYQRARRIVIAQMQVITYNEFLPALMGPNPLPPYTGYQPQVNASISNEFSTAAYRFGHSLLSPILLRLDENMQEVPDGHLSLADAFFNPSRIIDEGGIDPILRGLSMQVCQDFDVFVIDEVRNFLFGPPGAGGFDLPSLNIQRGRDHGLVGYNAMRQAYGLPPVQSFDQVSDDPVVNQRLQKTYNSTDDIDAWIGGLAEAPRPQALVGDLVFTILQDQFTRLRDGDRFWYQLVLTPTEIEEVESTTLADIIRRNTDIGNELADDVFRAQAIRQ